MGNAAVDVLEESVRSEGILSVNKGSAMRCALGTACMLCWVPLARYAVAVDWSGGFASAIPLLVFLMVAGLISLFAPVVSEGADVSARFLSAARAILTVLGCAVAVLFGNSGAGVVLALAAFGAGLALEAHLWFKRFSTIDAPSFAVGVVTGLLLSTGVFTLTLGIPDAAVYAMVAAAALTDAFIGPHLDRSELSASAGATRSKLLDISAAQFVSRYVASFFLLGLLSGMMLSLFSLGPQGQIDEVGLRWLPVGVVVLGLLLVWGWIRNHEPDFMLTLELSLVVALVAFFPFYPGTEFNQRLSLDLGAVWMAVLAGSFLLVSKEAEIACSPAGKHPFGLSLSALLMGLLCGAAGLSLLIESGWYRGLGSGTFGRITFVSALGAASIALAYICTNVLLNRDRLRSVRLLARGSFASLLTTPGSVVGSEEGREERGPSLEETCRDITLRYALTPREHDVLVILARGNSMVRVQEELVISEGTAITHRRNLYRKLGVANKQELIDFVAEKR